MSAKILNVLGGVGESGRNCYLLSLFGKKILLDCGVLRETSGNQVGGYPALTPEIAQQIDAVFLSHAHEDHCAALPYLYSLGYHAKVYASKQTASSAVKMIEKWCNYVHANHGTLPFTDDNVNKIDWEDISIHDDLAGIRFVCGKSGHTCGSLWIAFYSPDDADSAVFFYSGDFCLHSLTLAYDMPPHSKYALIDQAYYGEHIFQDKQYETILNKACAIYSKCGRLLLPVPSAGRGCDMLMYLINTAQHIPVFVEKGILETCMKLISSPEHLKNGITFCPEKYDNLHPITTEEDREQALASSGIIFTTDGMMTSKESLFYYQSIKNDQNSAIIITGQTASGTLGNNLLSPEYRVAHKILCEVDKIVIKVHPDADDIANIEKYILPEHVQYFHSSKTQDLHI